MAVDILKFIEKYKKKKLGNCKKNNIYGFFFFFCQNVTLYNYTIYCIIYFYATLVERVMYRAIFVLSFLKNHRVKKRIIMKLFDKSLILSDSLSISGFVPLWECIKDS